LKGIIILENIESKSVAQKTQCQDIIFKVFTLIFVNLFTSHRTKKNLPRREQIMKSNKTLYYNHILRNNVALISITTKSSKVVK
jgi:hypothetical protein